MNYIIDHINQIAAANRGSELGCRSKVKFSNLHLGFVTSKHPSAWIMLSKLELFHEKPRTIRQLSISTINFVRVGVTSDEYDNN